MIVVSDEAGHVLNDDEAWTKYRMNFWNCLRRKAVFADLLLSVRILLQN